MENEQKGLSGIILEGIRTRGLSVEKLAQATGVSDRFIELLLDERFEKLPSRPYVHGYLIKIGEALGLNGERLWNEFLKESNSIRKPGSQDSLPQNRFITTRFNKKVVFISVLALLAIGYAVFQLRASFGPPKFVVYGIEDGMITNESNLSFSGETTPGNQVFLNGEKIYVSQDGKFEKTIELQPGFNTLRFIIKKFLRDEYESVRQVFLRSPEQSMEESIQRQVDIPPQQPRAAEGSFPQMDVPYAQE